jgi:gas vesicle protein
MAYEYDRFEREDGSGSFLMGLLAGTVLGAGLGMLFAPKTGTELRSQLSESAGRLRSTANDTYHQASGKVSQMVDRGREAYDRARSSMGTGAPDSNLGDTNLGTGSSYGTTGSLGNTGNTGNTESMSGAGTGNRL